MLQAIAAAARQRMNTDIHTACWQGNVALVREFLKADPNLVNAADSTEFGGAMRPLQYAAYQVTLMRFRYVLRKD